MNIWRSLLAGAVALCIASCASRPQPTAAPTPPPAPASATFIHVASFHIKWLGHYHDRDDVALAHLFEDVALVFVQELVARPDDADTARFISAMRDLGFSYVIAPAPSGGNTTPSPTGWEWTVAFYRPGVVDPITPSPGFVGAPLLGHPTFDRVPYAFAFRAGHADLVFISVHLTADSSAAAKRARELSEIWRWVAAQPGPERDYVVLGDMNLQSCNERRAVTPVWATALGPCQPTNVRANRPFDQVMFSTAATAREISGNLDVVPLIERMRSSWNPQNGPYPGDPFDRTRFEQVYSDHNPIVFQIRIDGADDD